MLSLIVNHPVRKRPSPPQWQLKHSVPTTFPVSKLYNVMNIISSLISIKQLSFGHYELSQIQFSPQTSFQIAKFPNFNIFQNWVQGQVQPYKVRLV